MTSSKKKFDGNSKSKQNKRFLLFAFAFMLFAISCEQPIEGCTDINADNFNVTAGKSSKTTLCTYPKFFFLLQPYWGDILPFVGSTVYTIGSDSIKILSLQMYFSGINLTDGNNQLLKIPDSLLIYRTTDSLNIPLNLVLTNANTLQYQTFSLTQLGKISKFQFATGLDASALQAYSVRNPAGNPLSSQNGMTDSLNHFYFQKMVLARGASLTDTITLRGNQITPISFSGLDNSLVRGFSYRISLKIDYSGLFNNVDIKADTATLNKKIWSNLQANLFKLQ